MLNTFCKRAFMQTLKGGRASHDENFPVARQFAKTR